MTKIIQDINLGANLRELRESRNLSQTALAAQMTVAGRYMSTSTYNQIERGRRNIYLSDLLIIREVLDVSFDDIFRNMEPLPKYPPE